MPILGELIKPVYIYAGTLKTPETGKYKANKAYTAEPCIKACSSDHWQLYSRKRRKQTAEHWTTYGNRQTENRPTTAKQPEHINHSGIIGNTIPGSVNQQKPSDHDRLETSNPNRHNFQTILKSCTANFQIMEKPKKRYIIRAYTQGSDLTGSESEETPRRSREAA